MKRTNGPNGQIEYTIGDQATVNFTPTPLPMFPADTCFTSDCGKPAAWISILDGGMSYTVMCEECRTVFDNLPEFPVDPDRISMEPYSRDRADEVFAAIRASFKG